MSVLFRAAPRPSPPPRADNTCTAKTDAAAWALDGVAKDFSFGELEPDWERMAPFVEAATGRVPACESAGVKKFFCGPESFTPDLAHTPDAYPQN